MSAALSCGACCEPIREDDHTRVVVRRGYYQDDQFTLDVVTVHVDCDDPKGERSVGRRLPL